MDDHRDEPIFCTLGVGAILFRARPLPADHRVLHPADGRVNRNGHGLRIVERELRINLQRVSYCVRAVTAPQWLALLRPIAHGHHLAPVKIHAQRIPDKLARAGKCKIPHIVRLVDPRLLPLLLLLIVLHPHPL